MKGLIGARLAALACVISGAAVCLALAMPDSALAAPCTGATATCTWTGETATTATNPARWSTSSNWDSVGAPSGTAGDLVFPALTGETPCATSPFTDTCYVSNNDVSGIATTALTIDGASPYVIGGNGISVGSGGITANTSSATSAGIPNIALPLTLTSPQTWTISGSSAESQLDLTGSITGPADGVNIQLANGVLGLGSLPGAPVDDELGAVNVQGTGGLGTVVLGTPGQQARLNASSGQQVTFLNATLSVDGNDTTGPLNFIQAELSIGQSENAARLIVPSSVTLDQPSFLFESITGTGTPSPGANYSQLLSGGNVQLNAPSLELTDQYSDGTCRPLAVGTTYTLVQATTITGQFGNTSHGPIPASSCTGTPPTFAINYDTTSSPHTVTATVMTTGSVNTNTSLSVSPATPTANQAVTLTANVTAGGPNPPSGTVDFTDNGNQIPGCGAQTVDSTTGDATCQTSFASGSQSLGATYISSSGSTFSGSSGSETLTVAPAPLGPPPLTLQAATSPVSEIGYATATLNGLISTNASSFDWQFQFGTNTNYSTATKVHIAAGPARMAPVAWKLTGLDPGTLYHVRLVATTARGSSFGRDVIFRTRDTGVMKLITGTLKVAGKVASIPVKCSSKLKCKGHLTITIKLPVLNQKNPVTVLCDATQFAIKATQKKMLKAKLDSTCLKQLHSAPGNTLKAKLTTQSKSGQIPIISSIVLAL